MDVEQQHKAKSKRKRKQEQKGVDLDDALNAVGINKLPDDVIIAILSHMISHEAARTSVLSHRWRNLWRFSSGTLEIDDTSIFSSESPGLVNKPISDRTGIMRKRFCTRVGRLLKLHEEMSLDGLVIRFAHVRSRPSGRPPSYIGNWIKFAMQKKVKIFELDFSMPGGHHPFYGFPKVDDFGSLRSLRLVDVDIKDEVVVSLLASCPHLQRLCIRASWATENVRVVDPLPNLKVLEISGCPRIRNLEISVMSLVSCTYIGKLITFPFNEIPNVSELTLGGNFAWSLIYEPKKHSSYSVRLVKLALNINFPAAYFAHSTVHDYLLRNDLPQLCSLKHLELNVMSPICQNLHIFTWLIKASPLLNEFRIKNLVPHSQETVGIPPVFPELESYRCCHKNLKAFKMSGYVGCPRDDNFTLRLLEIAPLVETVTIDTESEYYEQKPWVYPRESGCIKGWDHKCICSRQGTGASTRIEAKERAEQLKFRFPPKMVLIIT